MRQHAPQIEIAGNATAVAERAAARVVARLRDRHAVTLGFATGATMRPVYARLVAATRGGDVSFRAVSSFNLDEYVGVAPQSPGSFHAYMQEHLFGHVDMEAGRARIPDGMAGDIAAEAARYEALIAAAGGIDEATRLANARNFSYPASVPERAITMGIATILEARSILLIATGPEKAAAVAAAIDGPIAPPCPASALRLHDNVHILCDEAAAAALANRPHNNNRRTA